MLSMLGLGAWRNAYPTSATESASVDVFKGYRDLISYRDTCEVDADFMGATYEAGTRTIFEAPDRFAYEVIAGPKENRRTFLWVHDGEDTYHSIDRGPYEKSSSVRSALSGAYGASGLLGGGGIWILSMLLPEGSIRERTIHDASDFEPQSPLTQGSSTLDVTGMTVGQIRLTVGIDRSDALWKRVAARMPGLNAAIRITPVRAEPGDVARAFQKRSTDV